MSENLLHDPSHYLPLTTPPMLPVDGVSLARLARTYRWFSDFALHILWGTQVSIIPLIKCLPPHLWEIAGPDTPRRVRVYHPHQFRDIWPFGFDPPARAVRAAALPHRARRTFVVNDARLQAIGSNFENEGGKGFKDRAKFAHILKRSTVRKMEEKLRGTTENSATPSSKKGCSDPVAVVDAQKLARRVIGKEDHCGRRKYISEAKFLSPEDHKKAFEATDNFKWAQVLEALVEPKTWLFFVVALCVKY
ncbi:hypothetical protein B0H13DRAFT_1859309 [Mycena leptocephala]|nr:hypothetical protein B0H13DRAFT_1859309 [Mycena leptocephala]